MKTKSLSLLTLLLTAVSGAWADSFSTDAYAANATLNGVSVNANQTVTINKDVTVTVNNGLTISTGVTLTVTGGGTLVVNGATGAKGNDDWDEGNPTAGGPGGAAITINGSAQLALSNATVIANGGQGGQGGTGVSGPDMVWAASGANGNGFSSFPTIDGAVLSYSTNGTDYTEYASGNSTLYRYMKAVAVAPATTYTATMKEGTEDAANWSITPNEGLNENDQVTIKYSGSNKVKSIKVKKVASTVPVSSITLNKTATEIMVGSTETLSVTAVAPDNATDKTYTWNTKDASKATVDQDGKVTAVAEGTVTIYAEANDGSGVTATCAVTVTPKLYSFTLTGPYSGTSLVVEFYAGQTWNDMITKYSSTLSVARGRYVQFSTDGMIYCNGMLARATDQLDPNGVYSLR